MANTLNQSVIESKNLGAAPSLQVCSSTQVDNGQSRLISLTQGEFAIVDAEDYECISKHKWYARKHRRSQMAKYKTNHWMNQCRKLVKQRDALLDACKELLDIVQTYEPHTSNCATQADPEDFGHFGCTCKHGRIAKQSIKAITQAEQAKGE